jgi:hypothetical protein
LNISWVVAEGYQFDPTVDVDTIKDIGPIWGSWSTWRGCSTDNVICNNKPKAIGLIDRKFNEGCNFYIPDSLYQELQNPAGVLRYGGSFQHDMEHTDDIVALHLASTGTDIVLMLGFDLTQIDPKNPHYYGHVVSVIKQNPNTQWVVIDTSGDLDKNFQDLTNLTCDTLGNVLQLLAQ